MADKKSPLYRGIGSYEGERSFQMKSPILRKGVYGAPIQKNYSPLTAKEGDTKTTMSAEGNPIRWLFKAGRWVKKLIKGAPKKPQRYGDRGQYHSVEHMRRSEAHRTVTGSN